MLLRSVPLAILLIATAASAQKVVDSNASFLDVPARTAYLRTTTNPLVRSALKSLRPCTSESVVTPPTGRIQIPHHYLHGSNGPTDPAEKAATRVYLDFERRISDGMDEYVATGSHTESACALAQLDAWAKANAMMDYDSKESSQAWFQAEWSLGSAAVAESVLVTDTTLDSAAHKRVIAWLDAATHKLIGFEKSESSKNNHHYFRANTAIATAILAKDDELFQFALTAYKDAIGEIDANGALPREMARHENASHYQGFALEPLIMIAEFAARQNIDLYAYAANGHTIRDAILFYGKAIADPSLIKPYAAEPQKSGFNSEAFAPFTFYVARFGKDGLPPSIIKGVDQVTDATRIGGNTTVLAAK